MASEYARAYWWLWRKELKKTQHLKAERLSKKRELQRKLNENENIMSTLVERQVLSIAVEVDDRYQFTSSNLTYQTWSLSKQKARFLVTFFLIWLHFFSKVSQQQVNWTTKHQYKAHCCFVHDHGEEWRIFWTFFSQHFKTRPLAR